MTSIDPNNFLGLPNAPLESADAIILPLPFERTVSYGGGTWRGPRAIIDASCQIEVFDEETELDFEEAGFVHTLPMLPDDPDATVEQCLAAITDHVRQYRGRFVLTLGGEHLIAHPVVTGLTEDVQNLTIVQLDAHADLADTLNAKKWSHGTVMKRLIDDGARAIQIGVRSLSRVEFDFAAQCDRVETFYAHQVAERWVEIIRRLRGLTGPIYLTIDVDGLDPSVIPSTGTPQPDGLSWRQTMQLIEATMTGAGKQIIGADVVEYIASPHPPGCDIIAARLVMKVLAHWWKNCRADLGA